MCLKFFFSGFLIDNIAAVNINFAAIVVEYLNLIIAEAQLFHFVKFGDNIVFITFVIV